MYNIKVYKSARGKVMAYIISADVIKEGLPKYNPTESDKFHEEAARLADKEFHESLKIRSEMQVVIMAGGAASGKTEYISKHLNQEPVIVFDGTLPSFNGAQIKIKKVLKANKQVKICLVLPDSLATAFNVFLNRDRKFPAVHFYRTHSCSRTSVLRIAKEFPAIPIDIYISKMNYKKLDFSLNFKKESFVNRTTLVAYLEKKQYNEEEIKNRI